MTTPAPSPPDFSLNAANGIIHLYRGEVGRMTSYRVRLDTTTNWAVITTAGLLGYAFSPQGPDEIMIAAMLMNVFFLHVEARRFRLFEISHLRVRVLEKFFYPSVLGDSIDQSWRSYMIRELDKPHIPLDHLQAVGWRLRRNYLWLYASLLIAWLAKLDISRPANSVFSAAQVVDVARIGLLPGWAALLLVLAFYAALIILALRARSYPLEMD
ncbi:DUF2270 domain-containing protein [Deinococcus yavapaiensis]|uniref:Putative membrane protein n=1 Tax=Deinococcus yavapaiensis KR-236 TaxID=694435 RepID=A0A318S370_9DEIO|nr:DUF2270 domain-containing protein [Deinococcus yavapaiensis]PYE48397.1 putative membrane protein [Deinococcus yavapaiensis KR-236]